MILLFITIIVTVIAIIIKVKSITYKFEADIILIICAIFALFNILALSTKSHKYDVFEAKGKVYQEALNNARENNNEHEVAAIINDVIHWNIQLADKKINNKIFIKKNYIDDRFETLEPIK